MRPLLHTASTIIALFLANPVASAPNPQASTADLQTSTAPNTQASTSPTPQANTPPAADLVPAPNGTIGWFQLRDQNVGTKFNRGAANCIATFSAPHPGGILGCTEPYATIGNQHCVDLNGRISVPFCGGVFTVNFPSEPNQSTDIHFTAANGTNTGCTASGKSSGNICYATETGQGDFGSVNYVGPWCVANIVQYQKTDPSAPASDQSAQYSYNITLFDNANPRNVIGGTSQHLFVAAGASEGIASKLPSSFNISSGKVDSDPYTISYNNPYLPGPSNQVFNAYDTAHQCSLQKVFPNGGFGNQWGYDNNARSNNCGFTC